MLTVASAAAGGKGSTIRVVGAMCDVAINSGTTRSVIANAIGVSCGKEVSERGAVASGNFMNVEG